MRNLAFLLFFVTTAPLAFAQDATLPEYKSLYVNDYADVLSEAVEATITERLSAVKAEQGVEMSVLTVKSRDAYGLHSSLEEFARNIFNEWGIGNASKNNGALMLVVVEDRQARIQLGQGYGRAMNEVAADILDKEMLPEFVGRNFETGVLNGTTAMIAHIAKGQDRKTDGTFTRDNVIVVGFMGLVAAVLGFKVLSRRRARSCPACKSRDVVASQSDTGRRQRTCQNCGHIFLLPAGLANTRNDDGNSGNGGSGGFGGGSSSGGGASGNW